MPRSLAVTICATDSYTYAMMPQARALHANLRGFDGQITIILVGGEKLKAVADFYRSLFGAAATVTIRHTFRETPGALNYKNAAQLLIAQMRTAASTLARSAGAELCWSLDADVIPKTSNCFRTLLWLLDMPGGYYKVAISPYPSQGGGDMLTGRAWPERPIAPDFADHERKVPEEMQKEIADNKVAIAELKGAQPPEGLVKQSQELAKKLESCPPSGNVFEVNGKFGFRRRGWLANAYPGMGRGCIVPSDWCGFGNTLMSREALDECDFTGYEGAGTEDLFVVWNRWHQAGLRIGSVLHEPSSHVSRRDDGRYFISTVRFVTEADEFKGECVGHLRIIQRPFYPHEQGEKFDPDNDGHPVSPAKREAAVRDAALLQAAKQPEQAKTLAPA